jgi:hypothetical protein
MACIIEKSSASRPFHRSNFAQVVRDLRAFPCRQQAHRADYRPCDRGLVSRCVPHTDQLQMRVALTSRTARHGNCYRNSLLCEFCHSNPFKRDLSLCYKRSTSSAGSLLRNWSEAGYGRDKQQSRSHGRGRWNETVRLRGDREHHGSLKVRMKVRREGRSNDISGETGAG